MQGDASTRAYERLTLDGASYILMNSPKRPDGPPVRDGKPYSAIAHLAENVTPFIAMAQALRARGFSAPAIFAADRDAGLAGASRISAASWWWTAIRRRRSSRATRWRPICWRRCIATPLPDVLPVEPGVDYTLPRYDLDALLIEAELLVDWYLPRLDVKLADAKRDAYVALWRDALAPALEAPPTWVLRDFHSPNLLWLPEREGVARIGLLDFQDAVMGPAAYDLASLRAGRARRRAGDDGDRAAVALHPRAAAPPTRLSTRRPSRSFTPRSPRSAPPRSSASSPASTAATASRNICVTCRGYGPICSARWRIRRWRRSPPGTASTCRRLKTI